MFSICSPFKIFTNITNIYWFIFVNINIYSIDDLPLNLFKIFIKFKLSSLFSDIIFEQKSFNSFEFFTRLLILCKCAFLVLYASVPKLNLILISKFNFINHVNINYINTIKTMFFELCNWSSKFNIKSLIRSTSLHLNFQCPKLRCVNMWQVFHNYLFLL